MRIIDCEQGSDEWFEARRGVISGTKAGQLLSTLKSGNYTAAREDAICELAMQRLSAEFRDPATGAAIRRGHEIETEARMYYEFETMETVQEVGFILHEKHDLFGCSPDGLIGDSGGVEFKAPASVKKHVAYLRDPQVLLSEYEFQVKQCLYVTGREWWDIASYDPCNKGRLAMVKKRLWAKDVDWEAYELDLKKADNEIEDLVAELRKILDGETTQQQAA